MKTAIVFSGAGLSADSGVPTFRDTGGLWENHKVEDVAEHEAWFRDKELVLKFYKERYEQYSGCVPHAGHYAIARLQEKYKVINVTQNIDVLLETAGCDNVYHLHGKINQKKCEWHKDITVLDGDRRFICDYKAPMNGPVELGDTCSTCGSQMRPDVVWFNEAVDLSHKTMVEWIRPVKYNDGVFICVGTSIQVFPAGYMVSFFSQVKNKFIVDRKPQQVANYELLEGNASEQLPHLVARLMDAD
jgi:NAD-dependent deacetylase